VTCCAWLMNHKEIMFDIHIYKNNVQPIYKTMLMESKHCICCSINCIIKEKLEKTVYWHACCHVLKSFHRWLRKLIYTLNWYGLYYCVTYEQFWGMRWRRTYLLLYSIALRTLSLSPIDLLYILKDGCNKDLTVSLFNST